MLCTHGFCMNACKYKHTRVQTLLTCAPHSEEFWKIKRNGMLDQFNDFHGNHGNHLQSALSPCFMWLEDAKQWKAPERFFSALLMKSRNLWWINLLELHGSNSNYQSEPTKNHQKICIARAYPNHIKQNILVVRVALLGTATSGRPKVFAFGNLVARRIIMNHYHWLHLNSTISEWC